MNLRQIVYFVLAVGLMTVGGQRLAGAIGPSLSNQIFAAMFACGITLAAGLPYSMLAARLDRVEEELESLRAKAESAPPDAPTA